MKDFLNPVKDSFYSLKSNFQQRWYLYLMPLFLFLGLYLQSVDYPFFLFDDPLHITNKMEVVHPSLSSMFHLWTVSKTPLILNVWQTVSAIFGIGSAAPYRLLNFFFHMINVYLFYILIMRLTDLMRERGLITAARKTIERYTYFSIFLFIVHPLLVESIVWVSSLKTILSTTFALLSFRIYLSNDSTTEDYKTVFLSFVPFVVGIIVKPAIVSLILIYFFLDIYLYNKRFKESLTRLFPFVLFVIIVIALQIAGSLGVGKVELRLHVKILLFFKTLFFYISKIILPTKLSFFYSENILKFEDSLTVGKSNLWLVLQVITLSIIFFVLFIKKNSSKISWGFAFMLFALLPHMGLLSFDFQRLSLYANRYSYFAFFGVVFMIVFIFVALRDRFSKNIKYFEYLFFVLLIFFSILSGKEINLWSKNSQVLARAYRVSEYADYVEQPLFATYMDEHNYLKASHFLKSLKNPDLGQLIELYHPVSKMYHQVIFDQLFTKILLPQAYSEHYLKFLMDTGKYAEAKDYLTGHAVDLKGTTYEENLATIRREMKDDVSQAWLLLGDYFFINENLKMSKAMYAQSLRMMGEVTDQKRAQILGSLMGADAVPADLLKAVNKDKGSKEQRIEIKSKDGYDFNKILKEIRR